MEDPNFRFLDQLLTAWTFHCKSCYIFECADKTKFGNDCMAFLVHFSDACHEIDIALLGVHVVWMGVDVIVDDDGCGLILKLVDDAFDGGIVTFPFCFHSLALFLSDTCF